MIPSAATTSKPALSSLSSSVTSDVAIRGNAGDIDKMEPTVATDKERSSVSGERGISTPATGDSGGLRLECPDDTDMSKSEGIDGGHGLRQRHHFHDSGPVASDSSMKLAGQMSPTNFPTTPDKTMSHGGTPEPSSSYASLKHSKRESYKAQKKNYRSQKKEAAKELLSTITDPAVVLLGDWLKVRGTLKSWTKLWCVLKPGVLVLYKSDKHKGSQWVGTILLNTCQLLERPSKKDGFCFKLFHPLDQSIWATKGPKGETIGAFVQPLPYSYCIFRAPSESAGKCWMDALELALKCNNLLKRSMTRLDNTADTSADLELERSRTQDMSWRPSSQMEDYQSSQNGNDHLPDGDSDVFPHDFNSMRAQERSMNESDLEKHFANQGTGIPNTMKTKDAKAGDWHVYPAARKDPSRAVSITVEHGANKPKGDDGSASWLQLRSNSKPLSRLPVSVTKSIVTRAKSATFSAKDTDTGTKSQFTHIGRLGHSESRASSKNGRYCKTPSLFIHPNTEPHHEYHSDSDIEFQEKQKGQSVTFKPSVGLHHDDLPIVCSVPMGSLSPPLSGRHRGLVDSSSFTKVAVSGPPKFFLRPSSSRDNVSHQDWQKHFISKASNILLKEEGPMRVNEASQTSFESEEVSTSSYDPSCTLLLVVKGHGASLSDMEPTSSGSGPDRKTHFLSNSITQGGSRWLFGVSCGSEPPLTNGATVSSASSQTENLWGREQRARLKSACGLDIQGIKAVRGSILGQTRSDAPSTNADSRRKAETESRCVEDNCEGKGTKSVSQAIHQTVVSSVAQSTAKASVNKVSLPSFNHMSTPSIVKPYVKADADQSSTAASGNTKPKAVVSFVEDKGSCSLSSATKPADTQFKFSAVNEKDTRRNIIHPLEWHSVTEPPLSQTIGLSSILKTRPTRWKENQSNSLAVHEQLDSGTQTPTETPSSSSRTGSTWTSSWDTGTSSSSKHSSNKQSVSNTTSSLASKSSKEEPSKAAKVKSGNLPSSSQSLTNTISDTSRSSRRKEEGKDTSPTKQKSVDLPLSLTDSSATNEFKIQGITSSGDDVLHGTSDNVSSSSELTPLSTSNTPSYWNNSSSVNLNESATSGGDHNESAMESASLNSRSWASSTSSFSPFRNRSGSSNQKDGHWKKVEVTADTSRSEGKKGKKSREKGKRLRSSHAEIGEGGKKKKSKSKVDIDGTESGAKADDDEGDKKKKKKKSKDLGDNTDPGASGDEGDKAGADSGGEEGTKKKKSKKKKSKDLGDKADAEASGNEGDKAGADSGGEEGTKKKKSKKKKSKDLGDKADAEASGNEGDKAGADSGGEEGTKKKKSKKKKSKDLGDKADAEASGNEGDKAGADSGGEEGTKKKKSKKKKSKDLGDKADAEASGNEGDKAGADSGGEEGTKKKKSKKKKSKDLGDKADAEASGNEGDKAGADSGGEEGTKKKKSKKKKSKDLGDKADAEASGNEGDKADAEASGNEGDKAGSESDAGEGGKKKKSKKRKSSDKGDKSEGDKADAESGGGEGGKRKKSKKRKSSDKGDKSEVNKTDAAESANEGEGKRKSKGGEEKIEEPTVEEGQTDTSEGEKEGTKKTEPKQDQMKIGETSDIVTSEPESDIVELKKTTEEPVAVSQTELGAAASVSEQGFFAGYGLPDVGNLWKIPSETSGVSGTESVPPSSAEHLPVEAAVSEKDHLPAGAEEHHPPAEEHHPPESPAVIPEPPPSAEELPPTKVPPAKVEASAAASGTTSSDAYGTSSASQLSSTAADSIQAPVEVCAPVDSASSDAESVSRDKYSKRNTSTATSENDDKVFDLPYGYDKEQTWVEAIKATFDRFNETPDLSKLCPKCIEALERQDPYGKTFISADRRPSSSLDSVLSNRPLFHTQKYKITPIENLKYEHKSGRCKEDKAAKPVTKDEEASGRKAGLGEDKSDREDTESTQSEFEEEALPSRSVIAPPEETNYILCSKEELGQSGDNCQTEEVTDENKSLIWMLVKQVRPGMDLSKVVLPTFILEPRSFLDKLSDYYYHANILSGAVLEESPYSRMKSVVRWYLSGFYKKPKGLKKPYNPVIGEAYRCCWQHPNTGSRTFYIAEQVSHHPPVSVFHVTNRKDGFNISGSVLARSKFYGNSLSALLDGVATLSFLERGEDYYITMPYAHCKGILIGTLTMELGGKVSIDCPKTGYKCELEFKLKPFLGSGQASNRIHGKILMGSDVLATIDGHWDQEIYMKDHALDKKKEMFWNPTPEIRAGRLKRFTVPVDTQLPYESERLWSAVSKAVVSGDMQAATDEKYVIEEEQRRTTRERKQNNTEWVPRYFEKDELNVGWIYKYADDRPWDAVNDVYQYEKDFAVQTQTRHKTPHVRAMSLSSLNKSVDKKKLRIPRTVEESDSSGHGLQRESDSSDYVGHRGGGGKTVKLTQDGMMLLLDPLVKMQEETSQALRSLQQQVARLELQHASSAGGGGGQGLLSKDWVTLAIILIFQIILQWIFR